MKRVFHKYTEWEDFRNGMYDPAPSDAVDELSGKAASLLSDAEGFYQVCLRVIEDWPIATEENLTNTNINRRAWIGQAACNYYLMVPESATKLAWVTLTDEQRFAANQAADRAISKYEVAYRELRRGVGTPMLF